MKEIDLKQIKSMEELKKELGNKYDEIMYKMNLELLKRMDKAIEYIENYDIGMPYQDFVKKEKLLNVLKGSDKE